MKTLISLKDIEKSFGTQKIIDHLNLDVMEGEFLTLLGPSGCGKTTLLRMINGFEVPDSGSVTLDGKDLLAIPSNKREVNTVFQSYALFPHLTVRENIAFPLRMKKEAEEEIKKKVDEVLELTKLEVLAERRPGKLSGGQQQRVAIARSLVNRPKVLLLDEPLGALDLKLRKQMQIELRQMQRDTGITYVYVTHDQEEALTISDRIVVLNGGKIEQMGEPWEIYHHPKTKFVATFLGESNFFEMEDSTIAVRPEFIQLSRQKIAEESRSARVEQVTYLGITKRIELKTENNQSVFCLSDMEVKRGESVYFHWNMQDAQKICS